MCVCVCMYVCIYVYIFMCICDLQCNVHVANKIINFILLSRVIWTILDKMGKTPTKGNKKKKGNHNIHK